MVTPTYAGETIGCRVIGSLAGYANGAAIPRATTSRLSLSRSLKGKRITVKVTGTKTGRVAG